MKWRVVFVTQSSFKHSLITGFSYVNNERERNAYDSLRSVH